MANHGLSDLVDFAADVDDIALLDDAGNLTFGDLDRRTAVIAAGLLQLARPGDVIAVVGGTTTQTALAILGVLRAGMVVMAVDPTQPPEHSAGLSRVASPTAVIDLSADRTTADAIGADREIRVIEGLTALERFAPLVASTATTAPTLDQPAMLFFSSGSSGAPKAVVYSRRTLLVVAERHRSESGTSDEPDRQGVLMTFPYTMGGVSLMNGVITRTPTGCFDLRDRPMTDLGPWLRRHGKTIMRLQTARFHTVLSAAGDLRDTALRRVGVGGEPFRADDARRVVEVLPPTCMIVARYGITEVGPVATGVVDVHAVVPSAHLDTLSSGVRIRIVDDDLADVAHGQPGELLVHTPALAVGYWNQPDLTAARFVELDGRRWFRTNDLACWDRTGLQLKGRRDHRVKVRGYNVDLSDVERALRELPVVADAGVVATSHLEANATLVAFVVPSVARSLTIGHVRSALAARLPAPMVPTRFHLVDRLPMLANGKLDRVRLTAAASSIPPGTPDNVVGPRSVEERTIHDILAPLVGHEELSVEGDLFDAGLDSLTTIESATALSSCFVMVVSPADILELRTIAALARFVEAGRESDRSVVRLAANAGGSNRAFVLVAGAGDLAIDVLGLGRHLACAGEILGVHGRGMGDGLRPEDNVGSFASRAAGQVLDRPVADDYVLIGYSYGGIVAVEIADALRGAGRSVRCVVLLDSGGPPSGQPIEIGLAQPENPGISTARETLSRMVRRWVAAIRSHRRRKADAVVDCEPVGAFARSKADDLKAAAFDVQAGSLRHHRRRLLPIPTLYVASTVPAERLDVIEHWRSLATSRFDVVRVSATHMSLVDEPWVGEVASHILVFVESA